MTQNNILKDKYGIESEHKPEPSNYVCPKCNSQRVNNFSFDFWNYCLDCGAEWRAV